MKNDIPIICKFKIMKVNKLQFVLYNGDTKWLI